MDRQIPDQDFDDNAEQADAGTQAQDVAADARTSAIDMSEDSERGGTSNRAQVTPDDRADLVETMDGMTRSGVIDMDAFAGEPQMDDEEDIMGATEDAGDDDGVN